MSQKLINLGAMVLVGDGLLGAMRPRRQTLLWQGGPQSYRALIDKIAARPNLARCCALVELGVGIWLASKQWDAPAKPVL